MCFDVGTYISAIIQIVNNNVNCRIKIESVNPKYRNRIKILKAEVKIPEPNFNFETKSRFQSQVSIPEPNLNFRIKVNSQHEIINEPNFNKKPNANSVTKCRS